MKKENEDGNRDALNICTQINIVNIVKLIVKCMQFTLWYIHGDNAMVWCH